MSLIYILCEGYDDRAFWQGFLEHLGASSLKNKRGPVSGKEWEGGGRYAYTNSAQTKEIVVQPTNGRRNIRKSADQVTKLYASAQLVLNGDDDGLASELPATWLTDMAQQMAPVPATIVWRSSLSPQTPGVPERQNLERLVCGALAQAYPERVAKVSSYLGQVGDSAKQCAYTYVAGWYAENGCTDFYCAVWRDPLVERYLIQDLGSSYGEIQSLVV